MNFAELKTELFARGTDYLDEDSDGVARAERWLNQAYREICSLHAWPFLEATTSGTSPLSVPDLRRVRYVRYSAAPGSQLAYITEEEAVNDGLDLTATGTADYYYIKDSAIYTAPVDGAAIFVSYIKRVAPLTGTDSPAFDEEYHNLIVDRAMVKAYQDGDNFEAAAALRDDFNSSMAAMTEDYMTNSRDLMFVSVDAYDG